MKITGPLFVCVGVSLANFAPASAQRIVGRVVEARSGSPIAGASVLAKTPMGDTVAAIATSREGRFAIDLLGPNDYSLTLLAQGYADTTLTVPVRGRQRVLIEVTLRVVAIPLDTVRVAVETASWWQVDRPFWEWDFWERRDYYERVGIGRFFTEGDLSRYGEVETILQLFGRRRAPPLNVRNNPDCSQQPSPFRQGPPGEIQGWAYYYNGARMQPPLPYFRPGDLIGIEYYQGAAQLPVELAGIATPCGVISFWIRR